MQIGAAEEPGGRISLEICLVSKNGNAVVQEETVDRGMRVEFDLGPVDGNYTVVALAGWTRPSQSGNLDRFRGANGAQMIVDVLSKQIKVELAGDRVQPTNDLAGRDPPALAGLFQVAGQLRGAGN